jgi:polysaccharide export outer membrane protein
MLAELGAPSPLEGATPVPTTWQPVRRPTEIHDTPTASAWRTAQPAPVVRTAFQAPQAGPMPVGPPLEPGAPQPAVPPDAPPLKSAIGPAPTAAQPTATADPPSGDKLPPPRPLGPAAPGAPAVGEAPPLGDGPPPPPAHPPMPKPTECKYLSLPAYVVEPPDILLIESTQQLRDQPIRGQHLVRPDGTISLGIYGTAYVSGMTLEMVKEVVAQVLEQRIKDFQRKNLYVDVLAYNSKFYYVITDGGGYGEQVIRLPITGKETVLDAISQINGLPPVASKKDIWVARSFPCKGGNCSEQVLPVDWCGITQHGLVQTNYQLMPGDRVYVKAQKIIRVDSIIAKTISPIERLLGVSLLAGATVQTWKGNGGGSSR